MKGILSVFSSQHFFEFVYIWESFSAFIKALVNDNIFWFWSCIRCAQVFISDLLCLKPLQILCYPALLRSLPTEGSVHVCLFPWDHLWPPSCLLTHCPIHWMTNSCPTAPWFCSSVVHSHDGPAGLLTSQPTERHCRRKAGAESGGVLTKDHSCPFHPSIFLKNRILYSGEFLPVNSLFYISICSLSHADNKNVTLPHFRRSCRWPNIWNGEN